jgi:hypothetical protein
MPSINGRFSDQDSYVVTGQVQTANNNQIALNASLAETDQIRGSSVVLQPTGLLATPPNLVPGVTTTLLGTVGAALGGIGQEGTASNEPGGGGIPCFAFGVPIEMTHGILKPIGKIVTAQDSVMAFDRLGNRYESLVIGKHEHWAQESLIVKFEDGRTTHTHALHPYWVQNDVFEPIFKLDWVWHWDNGWKRVAIQEKTTQTTPLMLYNLEVDVFRTYIANGDGVHNLKPADED